MTFTGDIPAVADLINHKGHTSYYGCRLCHIKGTKGVTAHDNDGMYFLGKASRFDLRPLDEYKLGSQVRTQNRYWSVISSELTSITVLLHSLASVPVR
jgi:hypothetical protein